MVSLQNFVRGRGGRGRIFFIFPGGELKSIDFTSFSCIPLFGGGWGVEGTSPFDSWLATSPPLASFNRPGSAKKVKSTIFSKHTKKFLGQKLPRSGYGI